MPKYAIINDQHFGVNGDSEFFHQNYREFYTKVFLPSVLEHRPAAILVPGDLWQSRKSINPLTLALAREVFFGPLEAAEIPVYIAYGNHDVYYKNTNSTNSIDFIGQMYDNVTVIGGSRELEGGVIMMSWWCAENEAQMRLDLANTPAKIVVGHFEVEGHLMTPGHVCDHGLPRSTFEKFDMVISGHFHVRGTDGKVTYTSNPSQTTWADFGLEKGFHYLDTDSRALTAVNNPHEVYAVVEFAAVAFGADLSTYDSKIVKVLIESYVTIDMVAFKDFLARLSTVAYKIVVVETSKFEGDSQLVVQGDVTAIPVRDVLVDYAKEVAGEGLKEDVAAKIAELYDAAIA